MSTQEDKKHQCLEAVAIVVVVEDEEVETRHIVLCKRGAINQDEVEVLDKIPIGQRSYNPLSKVPLISDGELDGKKEC